MENKAADALSRSMSDAEENITCKGLTVMIPLWLQRVKAAIKDSPYYLQLKRKLEQNLITANKYREADEVWINKNIIMVEPNIELCKEVFLKYHATPTGGHSGYQHTLKRIKHSFWWKSMKSFIKQAVRKCDIYQRNKHKNVLSPGFLQPLLVPEGVYEDITMEFIEGLPMVQGKNYIMVVVDRLTKFAHFLSLKHPYTAHQVALLRSVEALWCS